MNNQLKAALGTIQNLAFNKTIISQLISEKGLTDCLCENLVRQSQLSTMVINDPVTVQKGKFGLVQDCSGLLQIEKIEPNSH